MHGFPCLGAQLSADEHAAKLLFLKAEVGLEDPVQTYCLLSATLEALVARFRVLDEVRQHGSGSGTRAPRRPARERTQHHCRMPGCLMAGLLDGCR